MRETEVRIQRITISADSHRRGTLGKPFALRGLSRQQKRLDQLTLTAHRHTGKALVPLALGYIGLRVQPCGEQLKLGRRDLPALNTLKQILKQRRRKILAANFRHGRSDAVEAARQSLLDAGGFNRIVRGCELLREQS